MTARRIYKYQLEITDRQEIALPPGAQIVDVQFQGEHLCLWALVDGDAKQIESRQIVIVGTGNPVPDGLLRHLATVQVPTSAIRLVWHVFEAVLR